jgi:hypothetical protein
MKTAVLLALACAAAFCQGPIVLDKKTNTVLHKIVLTQVYISEAAQQALKDDSGIRVSVNGRDVTSDGPGLFREVLSRYLKGVKSRTQLPPPFGASLPEPIGCGFEIVEEPAKNEFAIFSGFPMDNDRSPYDPDNFRRAALAIPRDTDALGGTAGALVVALDYVQHDHNEGLAESTGVSRLPPDVQMSFSLSAILLQFQPGKKDPKMLWRSASLKQPGVWFVSMPITNPDAVYDDKLKCVIQLCVGLAKTLREYAPTNQP